MSDPPKTVQDWQPVGPFIIVRPSPNEEALVAHQITEEDLEADPFGHTLDAWVWAVDLRHATEFEDMEAARRQATTMNGWAVPKSLAMAMDIRY